MRLGNWTEGYTSVVLMQQVSIVAVWLWRVQQWQEEGSKLIMDELWLATCRPGWRVLRCGSIHNQTSTSDPSLSSFSWSKSSPSPFALASKTDDRAGAGKSNSVRIAHLMYCKASTMSPLSQLRSRLIVIPPWEKARSLETEDDIIAR